MVMISLQPLKRPRKVSIAIPASIVSDTPHLREKTFKVGTIGRATAIFRVDEVIIYPDLPQIDQSRDTTFILRVLSYMETPQYLRKRLFPFEQSLQYVGILPPLRTPHHPVENKLSHLKLGSYREGVVVKSTPHHSLVDIGVEKLVSLDQTGLPVGERITVKVVEPGGHCRFSLARPEEIEIYWGFRVTVSKLPLGRLVRNRGADLIIATSRYGVPLSEVEDSLRKRWKTAKNVLVAFGAPAEGLREILLHENLKLEEVAHFTVNTVPMQGTETVRTEEAIYASLAVLNMVIGE